MTDLENTLLRAQDEIRRLRAANADMGGKLEIVELFKAIIMPRQSQGMGEDVVWMLEQQIKMARVKEAFKSPDPKPAEAPGNVD